jgi:hypothetical protein
MHVSCCSDHHSINTLELQMRLSAVPAHPGEKPGQNATTRLSSSSTAVIMFLTEQLLIRKHISIHRHAYAY